MMGRFLLSGVLLVCACHVRLDELPQEQPTDGGASDATPDGPAVLGPWGTPTAVGIAATAGAAEDDGTLSRNTLELVFAIAETNGKELYYASRASPTAAWSAPSRLPFNDPATSDETPRFSSDDLTLYFASARAGGAGNLDIYQVTRPAIGGAWGTPSAVPGVNSAAAEKWFVPCDSPGRYLVIVGPDVAEGTLPGAPTVVATLSDPVASETGTFLTQNCLTTYFSSSRGALPRQIFTSSRASLVSPWSTPVAITDFDMLGGNQEDPWLASDGRTFLFVTDVSGTKDLHISVR